jgi:hypothetical protein
MPLLSGLANRNSIQNFDSFIFKTQKEELIKNAIQNFSFEWRFDI